MSESDSDLFNFQTLETVPTPKIRILNWDGEPLEPESYKSNLNVSSFNAGGGGGGAAGGAGVASQKNQSILRKRPRSSSHYSYVKSLSKGSKIIRIEIFDANQIENKVCECDAEMCVQHVVSNTLHDEVYKSIRTIITKISDLIDMI